MTREKEAEGSTYCRLSPEQQQLLSCAHLGVVDSDMLLSVRIYGMIDTGLQVHKGY